ncbi:hypothetical protein AB4089_15825 [Arthrobacter sp. 2MCAF15]|uniref:hypothetical protein n=1 Tax=Arthrobacter sp. 2MCAF15 TaxID=3232984 RepID=UPI003F932BA4
MEPAAASFRAGRILRPSGHLRPVRRVLLAAVAGAAWLTLSAAAAQADDACTFPGPAEYAGSTAPAAGCADADDLPVPAFDGLVSLDIAPAPAHTWSAGAVPCLQVAAAAEPAAADAAVTDAPPPATQPGDVDPAGTDPANTDPTAPAPALPGPIVTPPATVPVVDPGVPGAVPAVPDPGIVPPVVDPSAPSPVVDPPVVDPAVPIPDPVPLPGDPAATPAGTPAGTPAAVDGASPSAGNPTAGSSNAGTANAGTPNAGTATPDAVNAGTAKAAAGKTGPAEATSPAPSASGGSGTAALPAAYRAPVAYSAWLVPERRPAAAPVAAGAAPPAEPPAGTGEPPAPAGNPGPSPWHGGTGLPVPDALPPAPGSGSGSGHTANGPTGTAAWMPSLFFSLPTTGADPISGPLQHEYSAVCADPGSSPD